MAAVVLARGKDQRIKAGHLWVYASEIASVDEGAAPGDVVEVRDFRRRLLGRGTYNPASTLAVRIFTRHADEAVDRGLFERRIEEALAYRSRLFPAETTLRLIFSEGDHLPGLVVDRYGDFLCLQFGTLGMERFRSEVLAVLKERLDPAGIYERSDLSSRVREGLPPAEGILLGSVPEAIPVILDGLEFRVRLSEGQKTGFYLDQRLNRREIVPLSEGKRVLDAFCNTGGFGLYALKGGAASVVGVDISATSVLRATEQAALNGFQLAGQSEWLLADTTFSTQVREMKRADADIVAISAHPFTTCGVLKEMERQGVKPKLLIGLTSSSSIETLQGCAKQAEGIIIPTSFAPVTPEAKMAAERVAKFGGSADLHSAAAYEIMFILKDVIEAQKIMAKPDTVAADRVKMREGLVALKETKGLLGKVGRTPDREAIKPFLYVHAKDGSWQVLYNPAS